MTELVVYATSGMVARLREAQQQENKGPFLSGVSFRGYFFSPVQNKKHRIQVKLGIEQSGAEFRRRRLFIEPGALDLLKKGGDSALITLCGELVKQTPEAGLEKCIISVVKTKFKHRY